MKLRNRRSHIAAAPDSAPPKPRGPRLTHYLYLLVLAGLITYLAYIAWQRFMFIEAKGQIEVEKVTVSPARGGRALELLVQDSKNVQGGETLARLAPTPDCTHEPDTRDLDEMQLKASLTASEVEVLSDQLEELRFALAERRNLRRALEVDTRLDDIARELNSAIDTTQTDLAREKARLEIQRARVDQLERELGNQPLPPECKPETIIAPESGRIHHVSLKPGEVAKRAEPILTLIPDSPTIWIDAMVPNHSLEEITTGKPVTVKLPGGEPSEGTIVAITSTSSNVVRPDWEPEPPPADHARVIIHPRSRDDAAHWQRYDGMTVTVRARQ